jgi:SAM-dependent methyltransferase
VRRLRSVVRTTLAAAGLMPKRAEAPDYLHQQVQRSWSKESRNLQWFGLKDGMSILDLGCGPGHFAERLADRLPTATITALDADERMLGLARLRLPKGVTVVQASAERTGLPAESFDFVLARLLMQHAPDPLRVLSEAQRLLKPGGKLVITDVDDELFGIVEPRVSGLDRLLARYGKAQARRGGDRRIGRRLIPLLRDAGFADAALESVAIHSGEAGIDACFPQLDALPLRSLLAGGDLPLVEYLVLRAARRKLAAAKNPFVLVLLFMACGTKGVSTGTALARGRGGRSNPE